MPRVLSRLQLALAVAGLVAPAAAGAAPTVVLTAPRATLAVQDATHAAETAQRAAAAVDRIGYVTPHAFCLRVHSADYAPGDEGCESQQLPTTDDPVVYTETGVWVGGAVPAEAATVELVPAHGAPVRTPALAGDYDGVFAGRVRFFLASAPEPPRRIRVYDAGGALIGDDGFEPASVVGHRVALGGGRLSGHQRWSATAWAARATEPAAGAPERLEPADCLRVRLTARDGSSLAIPACQDSRRTAAGLLDLEPECTTRRIAPPCGADARRRPRARAGRPAAARALRPQPVRDRRRPAPPRGRAGDPRRRARAAPRPRAGHHGVPPRAPRPAAVGPRRPAAVVRPGEQ
jgi:hypothetical protein